jgi:transposase-like protein
VIEPARPGRHRRRSAEENRRIVEETTAPGQSVSSVSRRYGVSSSQVFRGRRLVDEGTMSVLMSVLGADESGSPSRTSKRSRADQRAQATAGSEDVP